MALNQFTFYLTVVEKEGPLIKLWGQLDRKAAGCIDEYLVKMNEQFMNGVGKPHPSAIAVGQTCCAQYNGVFYRARVISIANLSAGFVVVRFIDYGNSRVTSVDELRVIDEALAEYPPQATECYFYGVACIGGADLEEVTIDYMRQQLCYRDFQGYSVLMVNDKKLVKLFLNGVDLGEAMITQKLAVAIDQQHQETLLKSSYRSSIPPSMIQHWQVPNHIPQAQKMPVLSSYDLHGLTMPVGRSSPLPYGLVQPSVQPPGEMTVKTFTSPILEPNSEHNVYVSNVEDGPLSFAVQLQAAEQTLIAVTADIASHRPIPLREPPVPGSVCLARFPGDTKLSRATIMEVMDTTCRLYYVDFGNVSDVPYTDIFELPAKLINPKAMALRFCLAGLKNGPPPSKLTKEAFKDVVRGFLLRLRVAPNPEGPPLKQYGYLFREGKDVRGLYEELARERSGGVSHVPKIMNYTRIPLAYDPPKTGALVDGTWVTISHLNSPDEFWVQLESDETSLEQVMALLDDYCKQSPRIPSINDIQVRCPIFARFSEDDKWYRANVTNIEKEGPVVHVEFVDYGNEEGVSDFSRLRMAEPAIVGALAAQAIRCRLNGAAALRSKVGAKIWEEISIQFSESTLESRGMVKLGPRGIGDPVVVLEELRDDTLSPPVIISMDGLYKTVMGVTTPKTPKKVDPEPVYANAISDGWQEKKSPQDYNANAPQRPDNRSQHGRFFGASKGEEDDMGRQGRNGNQEIGNWEGDNSESKAVSPPYKGGRTSFRGSGEGHWNSTKDERGGGYSRGGRRGGDSHGWDSNRRNDDDGGMDNPSGDRGGRYRGGRGGSFDSRGRGGFDGGSRGGRRGEWEKGQGHDGDWDNKDGSGQSDNESSGSRGGGRGGWRGGDRGGFRGGNRGGRGGRSWDDKDSGDQERGGFGGGGRGGRSWDNKDSGDQERGGFGGGRGGRSWDNKDSGDQERGGFGGGRGGRSWDNKDSGDQERGGFGGGRGGRSWDNKDSGDQERGGFGGGRGGRSWDNKDSGDQERGGFGGGRGGRSWDNKDSGDQERGGFGGGRGGRSWDNKDSGDQERGGFGGGRGGRGGYRDDSRRNWRDRDSSGQDRFGGSWDGKGGSRGDSNEWDGGGGRSRGGRGGSNNGGGGRWDNQDNKFGGASEEEESSSGYGGGYRGRGGRGGFGRDGGDRPRKFNDGDHSRDFGGGGRGRRGGRNSYQEESIGQIEAPHVDSLESWDNADAASTAPPPPITIAEEVPVVEPASSSSHIPQQTVLPGAVEPVDVVFVESRLNFFCNLKSQADKLEKIVSLLSENYETAEAVIEGEVATEESTSEQVQVPKAASLHLSDTHAGMPCAALFSDDGEWYRGCVVGEPTDEGVTVRFVDYGNEGTVGESGLRQLPKDLFSLPAQAICCSLLGINEDSQDDALDADFDGEVSAGLATYAATIVRKSESEGNESYDVILRNKDTGECLNTRFGGSEEVLESNTDLCAEEGSLIGENIPKPVVTIGSTIDVDVSYVASRKEFYCQPKSTADKLEETMSKLALSCTSEEKEGDAEVPVTQEDEPKVAAVLNISDVKVGMPCAALFPEDQVWYRARVVAEPNEEGVTVNFVDYGNKADVTEGGLRVLPSELSSLPAQAICCSLAGLKEESPEESETLDVDFEIEVTSEESNITITFVRRAVEGGDDAVQVILKNKDTGECLNTRFGGSEELDELAIGEQVETKSTAAGEIPEPSITMGATVDVTVVYVAGRKAFFCQPKSSAEELEELMEKLTSLCSSEAGPGDSGAVGEKAEKAASISVSAAQVGMPCAALFPEDQVWYRARVVAEPNAEGVTVNFVDYGNKADVTEGGLRVLPSELSSLPAQAICCSLAGLKEESPEESETLDVDFEIEVTSEESNITITFVRRAVEGGDEAVQVILKNKDTGECLNTRFGGSEETPDVGDDEAEPSVCGVIPKPVVVIGDTIDVDVVYVASRKEFFCQPKITANMLQDLMAKLAAACVVEEEEVAPPCESTLRMLGLRPGMFCAALYAEDSVWYRAQVLDDPKVKDSGSGFIVRVKFIDYGNEAMVEDSGIRDLIPELMAFPAQAVPCRLVGFTDDFEVEASKELEFEEVTMDPEVSLEAVFVSQVSGGDHMEIVLKDLNSNTNINEQFGAVGQLIGGNGFGLGAAMPVNYKTDVVVVWFVSPFRFYVQPTSWAPDLAKFMASLQKVTKRSIFPWPPATGTPVLAKFPQDGGLYRAVVESTCPNSLVRVQYVDYGNRESLSQSQVWAADPSFKTLFPRAIPCALKGVSPVGDAWPLPGSPDGSVDKYFADPCSCIFHSRLGDESKVYGGMDGEVRTWVTLLKSDGSSIADELVSAGMARHDESLAMDCIGSVQVEASNIVEGEELIEEEIIDVTHSAPLLIEKESIDVTHSAPLLIEKESIDVNDSAPELIEEESIDVTHSAPELIEEESIDVNDSAPELIEEESIDVTHSAPELIEEENIDVTNSPPFPTDNEVLMEMQSEFPAGSGEELNTAEGTITEGGVLDNKVETIACDDQVAIPESSPKDPSLDADSLESKLTEMHVDWTENKESSGEGRSISMSEAAPDSAAEKVVTGVCESEFEESQALNMDLVVEKLGEMHRDILESKKGVNANVEAMENVEVKVPEESKSSEEVLSDDVDVKRLSESIDGDNASSSILGLENGPESLDLVMDELDLSLGQLGVGQHNTSASALDSSTENKDVLEETEKFEDAEDSLTSELAKDVLKSTVDGDKDAAARVQLVVDQYYQETPVDKIQIGGDYFTVDPANDPKVVPVEVLNLSGTLGAVVKFQDGCVDEVPLDKIYGCPPDMAVLPSPEASPMSSLTVIGDQVVSEGSQSKIEEKSKPESAVDEAKVVKEPLEKEHESVEKSAQ